MREAAIVAALTASGPMDTAAVVGAVYPDLDEALVPLAAQSATAHLRKLVADGVATRQGERWAVL